MIADALTEGIIDRDSAHIVLADRLGDVPMTSLAADAGVGRRTLERRRARAVAALVGATA